MQVIRSDSRAREYSLAGAVTNKAKFLPRESGLTLIEILIAVLILGVGLISTLALQGVAKSGNLEAFQRTQAVLIAQDIAERISSNREADLEGYEGTYTGSTVTSYSDCLGTTTCTPTQMISWDRYQFDQAILGASEVRGGKNTGSLINAEGCVEHSSGLVTVVVVWQGVSLGTPPTPPIDGCGDGIDSSERRMFAYTTFVGEPS